MNKSFERNVVQEMKIKSLSCVNVITIDKTQRLEIAAHNLQ